MKLEFSGQIFEKRKKAKISSFVKIRPVRSELFHADARTDGQSDVTKVTGAFRNVAKAPSKAFPLSSQVCSEVHHWPLHPHSVT